MVGTRSSYDHDGEREQTVYFAAAPEYGKYDFTARLLREIVRAKAHSMHAGSAAPRARLAIGLP
jgi:hypothetical protein